MKNLIKNAIFSMMLMIFPIINLMADPPSPPSPGGTPVGTGTPVGAPIDNGVFVLIVLGIIYGTYKLYQFRGKHHNALK